MLSPLYHVKTRKTEKECWVRQDSFDSPIIARMLIRKLERDGYQTRMEVEKFS